MSDKEISIRNNSARFLPFTSTCVCFAIGINMRRTFHKLWTNIRIARIRVCVVLLGTIVLRYFPNEITAESNSTPVTVTITIVCCQFARHAERTSCVICLLYFTTTKSVYSFSFRQSRTDERHVAHTHSAICPPLCRLSLTAGRTANNATPLFSETIFINKFILIVDTLRRP